MRPFLQKIGIYLLLTLLMLGIGLALPDIKNRTRYLYGLRQKHDLLARQAPHRVVLIGGSNLAFGLNSQSLSDSLGVPVINVGVHAGLGLRFMLLDLAPRLQPGDIVILSPEYQHFFNNKQLAFYGADELLNVVFEVAPGTRGYLSVKHWAELGDFLPKYIGEKYANALFYGARDLIKGGAARSVHPYHIAAMNAYGDMTYHWDLPPKPITAFPVADDPLYPEAMQAVADFQRAVQQQGATLYWAYPPCQGTSLDHMAANVSRLDQALDRLGVKRLSGPQRYRMPDEFCYDTPYHLVRPGVQRRTQYLLADLRQQGLVERVQSFDTTFDPSLSHFGIAQCELRTEVKSYSCSTN